MFTMFFSGGMIPAYLNIRDLGLYNSLWALILPGALSVYNSIICKTAIESVPESLKESAYIDGANDVIILFRIIVPLIKASTGCTSSLLWCWPLECMVQCIHFI